MERFRRFWRQVKKGGICLLTASKLLNLHIMLYKLAPERERLHSHQTYDTGHDFGRSRLTFHVNV